MQVSHSHIPWVVVTCVRSEPQRHAGILWSGPMAQQHLDRLTSTDASFLHQESSAAHMHVGGVLLFEGPAPKFEDILEHIRGRLHLIPRYRQKLATPPAGSG